MGKRMTNSGQIADQVRDDGIGSRQREYGNHGTPW
jgi:hypothetical protein